MPTRQVQLEDELIAMATEQARQEGTTAEQVIAACVEKRLGSTGSGTVELSGSSLEEAPEKASKTGLFSFSFIRRLSHEVRTAVTSILGFTEILETEVAISQQELVEIIQRSGERLLRTIDAVVYLGRLEEGDVTTDSEPLDIGRQVDGLVEPYRRQAQKKGLKFDVEEPPSTLLLDIDPDVLAGIVEPLVDNAVKFTSEGEVTVRLAEEDRQAVLEIRDTGCGIDEAVGAAIFEPFSQRGACGKDRVAGPGLGLTVSRKLAEVIGAAITWESASDEGSTFTVRFPTSPSESLSSGKARKRSHRWGFDQLPPDQRVLLVEDDPGICQLVPVLLPDSYTIDVLTDTSAVLEQAETHRYDIVLMDINLGEQIDGVELMRRMRKLDGYGDALFIAVTAYPETRGGETFHEKGFDGYVGKPFSKKALYENLIQV